MANAPACEYSLQQALNDATRKKSVSQPRQEQKLTGDSEFLATPRSPSNKKDKKGKVKSSACVAASKPPTSTTLQEPATGARENFSVLISKWFSENLQQVTKDSSVAVDFDACVKTAVKNLSPSDHSETVVIAALKDQLSDHFILVLQKMEEALKKFYVNQERKEGKTVTISRANAFGTKSKEVTSKIIEVVLGGEKDVDTITSDALISSTRSSSSYILVPHLKRSWGKSKGDMS